MTTGARMMRNKDEDEMREGRRRTQVRRQVRKRERENEE